MQRIDSPSAIMQRPTSRGGGTPGYFTGGNPLTSEEATIVTADFLNNMQETICHPIEASGQKLDKARDDQITTAIRHISQDRAYDAVLASRIGGYPKGAIVSLGDPATLYVSLSDKNLSAPDKAGSQWLLLLGDCVRTKTSSNADSLVTDMVANLQSDPLGQYLTVNSTDREGFKIPGENWVRNYADGKFVPLTGGEIDGSLIIKKDAEVSGHISLKSKLEASDSSDFVPTTSWVMDAVKNGEGLWRSDGRENGWVELPGGIIVQWGVRRTYGNGRNYFSFPVQFPAQCYVALANESAAGGTWGGQSPTPTLYALNGFDRVGFNLFCLKWSTVAPWWLDSGDCSFNFIAIGR